MKRSPAALLFALAFPSLMTWLYFVAVAPPAGVPAATGMAGMLALLLYYVGKTVQLAFPLWWVWWREGRSLRPVLPAPRGLALGVGFGLAVGAAVLLLYHGGLRGSPLLVSTADQVRTKLATFHVDTPERFLLLAGYLAVLHSLLEEYYWRWFVFGGLKDHLPWPAALVVASLGFMAHHVIVLAVFLPGRFWQAAVPLALGVAVGGGVWCWLYHRTGSLYAAWLSHLLIDAAILAVGYDLAWVGP